MFNITKIAFAAALVFGAASAALANDSGENHQDEDRVVVWASVARVNHAGGAYGYVAAPTHKHTQSR